MKKTYLILIVLFVLFSCNIEDYAEFTYTVDGDSPTSISYKARSGEWIDETITPPWEYSGEMDVYTRVGIISNSTEDVTITLDYFVDKKVHVMQEKTGNGELILIYRWKKQLNRE